MNKYYCKYHDIVLCEKHQDGCLSNTCNLIECDTTWNCSVCNGIISYVSQE